ncbi:hypothetical protein DAEQUDRAFT_755936 [Daedalea quercina L-15889]|uniref:F-box domain-containing protein n=1 Tax=Daedalea quercina L-15889 TaxID=1314783 RepID=A0A165RTA1_9APHY|nr:hypothetical protein DAEQUDRAFT_755936 [Daedalea quercina L-15889]
MSESKKQPSSTIEPEAPYIGCPACTTQEEAGRREIRPLPEIAPGPDGTDWNHCYWGNDGIDAVLRGQHERTIIRPLPRNITDRIPPEIISLIIDSLEWETEDLYNCASVCRAWHHRSQVLLYTHLVIEDRRSYDAIIQFTLRSERSRHYLRFTRTLRIELGPGEENLPPSHVQRNYFQSVPLVLPLQGSMPLLQCLEFYNCLYPPYHGRFITFMSRFTELMHLALFSFEFRSFADLRRIVCSLPKLHELELMDGKLSSASASFDVPSSPEHGRLPRVRSLSLKSLELNLLAPLATWVASTSACKYLTNLVFHAENDEKIRLSVEHILEAGGPSLTDLEYKVYGPSEGSFLDPLVHCTHLSNVNLFCDVDPVDSWRAVVVAFHGTFSQLRSTRISTLQVMIWLDHSDPDGPDASPHSDNEFRDVDLRPVQETIARPLFDSLVDVMIMVGRSSPGVRLTSDLVITAEKMERRIRSILQPWDKREILAVECRRNGY